MSTLLGVGLAFDVMPGFGQVTPTPESGLQVSESRSQERFPADLQLPPPIVTSQTQFEIPFRTDDVNGRLVEVQLYVSTDLGVTWNVYARQSPATTRIPFQSVGDGEYLFALKTLDRDGRLLPTGPPIPTLRMVIDTVQPELNLSVEPDKSGRIAITWHGTDHNLDKSTLRLSYRLDGANLPNQWLPLATGSPVTSEHSADPKLYQDRVTWLPDSVATAIVLKAEIQDHAGNVATIYQPMSLGNLRSTAPGPLLQGGQTSVLSPPNPEVQSTQAATNNSLASSPGGVSSSLAAIDPAKPIDWPAANQPGGGLSIGGQTGGGQTNLERASLATGQRDSAGPANRTNARPANWSSPPNDRNQSFSSIAPNPNLDPFRQSPTNAPDSAGSEYEANLASQNLAVAVGTTLRPSRPAPSPDQDPSRPTQIQATGGQASNGGQTSNGGQASNGGQTEPISSGGQTVSIHPDIGAAAPNPPNVPGPAPMPPAVGLPGSSSAYASSAPDTRYPANLSVPRQNPAADAFVPGAQVSVPGAQVSVPSAQVPVPSAQVSVPGADRTEVSVPNRVPNRVPGQVDTVRNRGFNPPPWPPTSLQTANQSQTAASSPTTNTIDREPVRFSVNTLQFRLRYQIDGLQPERIATVSIFGSRDRGQTWELWTEDRDRTSPVEITVPNTGEYGFRVVITSSTGSSSYIPRPGDPSEIEVNVDRDPPTPRITAVPYGQGLQPSSLLIQWNCSDNDLAPTPISLAFSHSISGPWTTIEAHAANIGQFEWTLQPNLPNRVYLQISATDLAGNRGQHILESPIDIGALLPRGRILGLDR
ncbi:MAG: hypothetical protein JNL67_10845 [Planctomycetaceae bacterium]|nr:hypothetical protein [Planctomycetaceae bacterium]